MALVYINQNQNVDSIISNIQEGKIGLPELQRPFVWPDTKARDLLTSMIKGFPIGFIIMWAQPSAQKTRQIGLNEHNSKFPGELIIDGQQRLTTLYSIITGNMVLDNSFKPRKIILSYNPFTEKIEVGSGAYKNSPDWVYDISDLFTSKNIYVYAVDFANKIKNSKSEHSSMYMAELTNMLMGRFTDLTYKINKYLMPVLNIAEDADEEEVSDIFVGINSGGTKLNQSDFILTLVSVNYPEGRDKIEQFCKDTKIHNNEGRKDIYNEIISFDPNDIIRVLIGYGFKRGRLKYGYKLLRGADFEKRGEISEDLREERFSLFQKYLDHVIDRNEFLEFLKCASCAGFETKKLLYSTVNIAYAYAYWLIGRHDFNLSVGEVKKVITKAIYLFNLTSRYSGSFESRFEEDLSRLEEYRQTGDKKLFAQFFDDLANSILTNDFFNITLVSELETSSSINPSFLTYLAAQNILEARVLFSNPPMYTSTLYRECANGIRKAVELHHLFPKKYLKDNYGNGKKLINQVANYAFIEWTDNMDISDEAPSIYYKEIIKNFSDEQIAHMERLHALPNGWEDMSYYDFLVARRKLMAQIIKEGYEKLKNIQ